MFRSLKTAVAAFLFLLTAGPGAAQQNCLAPTLFGVADVQVSLITPPAAPGVASPTQTQRREHAYISSALAATFGSGVFDINANLNGPNNQIRVWIETPATYTIGTTQRRSQALFTVVGIVPDTRLRLWVYRQGGASTNPPDKHSGEYKLFASSASTATRGTLAKDTNNDGLIDGVKSRVLVGVPSGTTLTRVTTNNVSTTTTTEWYCEPERNPVTQTSVSFLRETARNMNDNQFALLVPHGGAIETDTSRQIEPFRQVLEDDYNIPVSFWNVEGEWKESQTFARWHITATALTGDAFPGLRGMLDQPKFDAANDRSFQYALALHGFDSATPHLIVGGRADRNARCLVADMIRDAVLAEDNSLTGVLVLEVPNGGGSGHLDGDSVDNLVNRLAAEGGIQLEQSKGLRDWGPDSDGDGNVDNDEQILIDPIAEAAAEAMGIWMTEGVSATFCADNGF